MVKANILHAVADRLRFVELMLNMREQTFVLQPAAQPGANGELDHPWRHMDGVCVYLMLTCFDMLGQPSEFLDFGAWLKSSVFQAERKSVIDSLSASADSTTAAQVLYERHLETFGVTKSFYRFFDHLDAEQSRKLLESVLVSRSHPLTGKPLEGHKIDAEKSKKALYQLRNGFTHSGQVPASVYPAFVKYFGDQKCVEIAGQGLKCGYVPVWKSTQTEVCKEISVLNWPQALLEAVRAAYEKAATTSGA